MHNCKHVKSILKKTILNIFYEKQEIIKKSVPQSAKISKLEWICSKFPSQLEFGGEHLFWGTACGVLFYKGSLPAGNIKSEVKSDIAQVILPAILLQPYNNVIIYY